MVVRPIAKLSERLAEVQAVHRRSQVSRFGVTPTSPESRPAVARPAMAKPVAPIMLPSQLGDVNPRPRPGSPQRAQLRQAPR